MKFSILKTPVILAILIDAASLILFIYSIREREIGIWHTLAIPMAISIVGSINRQIIAKGQGINLRKKIVVWTSFYSTIAIAVLYFIFMFRGTFFIS